MGKKISVTSKEATALLRNEYYPVINTVTKHIYVTSDGEAFVYHDMPAASQKAGELINGDVGECREFTYSNRTQEITRLYGMGVDRLTIDSSVIELTETSVKRVPFNRKTVKSYILFLETRQHQYMMELFNKSFLVPVSFSDLKIEYADFTYNNNDRMFPIFTSMNTFDTFVKLKGTGCGSPLLMTFDQICDVKNDRKLLIDFGTTGLILTDEQIVAS